MAYVRIVSEYEATGSLKEDYEFIAGSYSRLLGTDVPAPQVYRTATLIPAYFHFGAVQNSVLTNHGEGGNRESPIPNILVNYAVSAHSDCFY